MVTKAVHVKMHHPLMQLDDAYINVNKYYLLMLEELSNRVLYNIKNVISLQKWISNTIKMTIF